MESFPTIAIQEFRKNQLAGNKQLIQQHTILEAKRLLKSTDLSIKEIAFKSKQHTGLNPKQFKTD